MLDTDGSLVSPAQFLPIAERFGLIREIDRWVVTETIAILRRRQRATGKPTMEINLSGHSLGDSRAGRAHRPGAARGAGRSRPADLRGHRDDRDRQHRRGTQLRPAAGATRLPVRAGRLRRRIRLVLLPQAPAVRLHQDRRRVRAQLHHQRHRPARDLRRRQARPGIGHAHDRRVRRRRARRSRRSPRWASTTPRASISVSPSPSRACSRELPAQIPGGR